MSLVCTLIYPTGILDANLTYQSIRRGIFIFKALRLLNMSGYKKRVRNVAVSVYDLIPSTDEQLKLFASPTHAVSEAMDKINNKWGEFVITPALMMGMDDIILDRIAFGGVKELQDIYSQ